MFRHYSDTIFDSSLLVKLIRGIVLIDEDCLSTIKGHAMASIAMENSKQLSWVTFEGLREICHMARVIRDFRVVQEFYVVVLGAEF